MAIRSAARATINATTAEVIGVRNVNIHWSLGLYVAARLGPNVL